MKATLVAFPLYLLVAVLLVDNGAAQERAIRIGFPSVAFQELPLFAASKRGFFRAEGLNVELVQIAGSPAVAALLSGDVDYITHNSRIIATAARGGGVKSLFNYVAKPADLLPRHFAGDQASQRASRTHGCRFIFWRRCPLHHQAATGILRSERSKGCRHSSAWTGLHTFFRIGRTGHPCDAPAARFCRAI